MSSEQIYTTTRPWQSNSIDGFLGCSAYAVSPAKPIALWVYNKINLQKWFLRAHIQLFSHLL